MLVEVKTPAVVKWDLETVKQSVKEDIAEVLSISCIQDNIQSLKTSRARLNKDHRFMDDRISEMKSQYMKPWNEFIEEYNSIVAEYSNADDVLKAEINSLEDEKKEAIRQEIIDYIESITGERDETLVPKITLSASMKKLKEEAVSLIRDKNKPKERTKDTVVVITATNTQLSQIKEYAEQIGAVMEEM